MAGIIQAIQQQQQRQVEGDSLRLLLAALVVALAVSTYLTWFWALTRRLNGPKVWPFLGSLPGLVAFRIRERQRKILYECIRYTMYWSSEETRYLCCIIWSPRRDPQPRLALTKCLVL